MGNIKLVGVGGQGTILAAKVLCSALIKAGYDVKMTEIHGMSQRGGSVSSEIRYGEKIYSPVIEKGHADFLVSFEEMEAARNIDYLKKGGILIVNELQINSMVTLNGKVEYPKNIISTLKETVNTKSINGTEEAIKLGNVKTLNIIMLGMLVRLLKMEHLDFEQAIKDNVKPKFIDINLKAYKLGLNKV